MKKKILILPSWYPSPSSPALGIFVQDQAQVLMQNYDVCVIVPRLIRGRQTLSERVLRSSRKGLQSGVLVFREELFGPDRLPFQIKLRLYQLLTKIAFRKALMEWGMPDIIHAHVVYPAGCGAVWLGKRFGIPVVLTEHTGPFSVYLSQSVQKGAVSDTLVGANRVLAVSPALAEQIHAVFPEVHVDILGNVVMTKFFEPQEINRKSNGTSETAFLCIALLNKGKGVDDLLRASMQLVREGVLSFELLIGGDGVELPRLKDVAEKLGLQAHCQFLGMLTRSEVKNWMQKTDVFVLPSLGETFGLVAAEAMACGKPVIATRCGGPEFLMTNETGVLVDRSDPPALAEAMKGFISGRAQFDSGHIRDHVKTRFGEEVFLQKLAAIYERVLEEVAGSKVRSEFG